MEKELDWKLRGEDNSKSQWQEIGLEFCAGLQLNQSVNTKLLSPGPKRKVFKYACGVNGIRCRLPKNGGQGGLQVNVDSHHLLHRWLTASGENITQFAENTGDFSIVNTNICAI